MESCQDNPLERVLVQLQILRFVIDRDSSSAKFIEELRRRQTADFGRPAQRFLFALVQTDRNVHLGVTFVQRDVSQSLAWNCNGHFEDEGSPEAKILEVLRLFAVV